MTYIYIFTYIYVVEHNAPHCNTLPHTAPRCIIPLSNQSCRSNVRSKSMRTYIHMYIIYTYTYIHIHLYTYISTSVRSNSVRTHWVMSYVWISEPWHTYRWTNRGTHVNGSCQICDQKVSVGNESWHMYRWALNHTSDMSHSFIRVKWRTRSYEWHDSFIYTSHGIRINEWVVSLVWLSASFHSIPNEAWHIYE